MWEKLILIGLLGWGLAYLLTKLFIAGKKAEQLERLKKEVKARAKANEVVSRTINLNSEQLLNRVREKRNSKAGNGSMSAKD
ncbi:MAG: hypothetical protein II453_06990 [Alphaproteobacteria bacterium]|nr:hypothetical protein [Alphaproteobacteria bacterium]